MPNELLITCSYCGHQHKNEKEIIHEHMLSCEKRPEYALLLKIELLKNTGDELIQVLRAFTKVIANFEGGMTEAWAIYHATQSRWNSAKDINAHELVEALKLEDPK